MNHDMVSMTKGERECVKEQLLVFVKRVALARYDEYGHERLPEEVNALPAILQILLDWH